MEGRADFQSPVMVLLGQAAVRVRAGALILEGFQRKP